MLNWKCCPTLHFSLAALSNPFLLSAECFQSSVMESRGYFASCLAPRLSLDNDDGVSFLQGVQMIGFSFI